jgi:hypothetical protein
MYPQARIFIRTALVYLGAALLLGSLLLANQGLHLFEGAGALQPVFYHLLMVGWMVQFICGVALWLFPVVSRSRPRGDERLGWAAYATLNGGLLIRSIAEPLHSWQPQEWSGGALLVAALLQALGVWLLVLALWPRVRAKPGARQ